MNWRVKYVNLFKKYCRKKSLLDSLREAEYFIEVDGVIVDSFTLDNAEDNIGILNTFIGGVLILSTEASTTITQNNPTRIAGTFTPDDLEHFDSPANGELRKLGENPKEHRVRFDFILNGGSNAEYKMALIKTDGVSTTELYSQIRVVNNLIGGRDIAYFNGTINNLLEDSDICYWEVTNLTNNINCTLELSSRWSIEKR